MIDRPIRVALVGCGGMAKRYRTVYSRLPGVRWATAIDPNQETLDACRAEGAERCTTEFKDALVDDVDAVVISTPNHLHADQAVAALNAGKHILLQKPIANTLEAADRIVAAAKDAHDRHGVWAAMYMSNYDDPAVWAIKAVLDAGLLGTIQSVRARDAHRGGLTLNGQAWRSSRGLTGGGSFVQLSIHSINLMRWWLGAEVRNATALSQNRLCSAVGGDDCTIAAIEFSDRTLGVFDSAYASDGNLRELYGTRGWIRFWADGEGRRIELRLDTTFKASDTVDYQLANKVASFAAPPPQFDDISNPYNQNVQFINRIRDDVPPHMSVVQGRDDLAVVEAVYGSAQDRRPVEPQPFHRDVQTIDMTIPTRL